MKTFTMEPLEDTRKGFLTTIDGNQYKVYGCFLFNDGNIPKCFFMNNVYSMIYFSIDNDKRLRLNILSRNANEYLKSYITSFDKERMYDFYVIIPKLNILEYVQN